MIKKMIFLTISPFNKRDFKRFGIELLMKNGFEVEVWDLTNILFPEVAKNYILPDPIRWSGCKVFPNKIYALNSLASLDCHTFIIPFFHYNKDFYHIYKAISISEAKYASFVAGVIPPAENKRKLGKILHNFKKLGKKPFKKITNYVFRKIPFHWLGIKPASLILAGGEKSIIAYDDPYDSSTEVLWVHTFDYDLYLKEKNILSTDSSIAVFLDEYLPFHPDFIYMNVRPPISYIKYYPFLNKFFSLVERKLGFKVVIAAHPRSYYENHPDYFGGRKWIRGQTIKLVKESKLVLAHSSTALNFANLFYKPVIFLTCSELDKSLQGPFIRAMAKWFGKKPIFMDKYNDIDWDFELTVSKSHYDNYREAYIKAARSKDLPFWQIVANRLKKGF